MLRALIFFIIPFSLFASEPSAFGAGNLESESPYGLTPNEKIILKTKEKLNSIQKSTRAHESEVLSLRERLDGLQTIVEGMNEKSHTNRVELNKLLDTYRSDELEKDELVRLVQSNEESISKLKTVLTEFSTMIDTINANYVSKEEYNALVKDVNAFKSEVSKALKSVGSSKSRADSSPFKGMSKAQVAKKAREYYDKEYYTKAIAHYEYLIEKNYKPARAHYMIGEMWYYRKSYTKAISYFKESARIYDKASYMPTLLLHSAVSMEKTGDKENARAFYNALIAKYPDTKMAADAQKRVGKL